MLHAPVIPAWNAIHPLIVHFPIALLMIAPLFVLLWALLPRDSDRNFQFAALILMFIGTAGNFLARESGEAAAHLVGNSPQIRAVLEHHEDLAATTSIIFSSLTVIFAALVFVPMALRKPSSRMIATVLPLIFLVLYAGGMLVLANTAHNGGRLVHELGVKAAVASTQLPASQTAPPVEQDQD